MINIDIYGKPLSSTFNSKISATSQRLKPKILIDWLDTRHCANLTVTTNDSHPNSSLGNIGYFFVPKQAVNGITRQSYTWGVADALDTNGKTIKADGNWHAMPKDLSDNYEFGWWSNTKSNSNTHATYNGYGFGSNPTITTQFDNRKCNLIRITTSEFYGKIDTYRITVRSNDVGVPNPLLTEVVRIQDDRYFFDHWLPPSVGHTTIYRVEIEILTVKNPQDRARINEIDVVYQVDISDYIVSSSIDKIRDIHESSLPIAGASSGSVKAELDNSGKDFNVFGAASAYGIFMKKDLRIQATTGWQILKNDNEYIDKTLRTAISTSSMSMSISNTDDLPSGGPGDHFIMIIDPDKYTKEIVLCSAKSGTYDITIEQRGYGNTVARSHNTGAIVRFETFEYPAYTEAYIDEWSASSDSMTVQMSATDWSKFMAEKVVTNGFFLEKTTVPSACEKLLMSCNFPRKKIKTLNRYDITARKLGAILHYDFNESSIDRSGNSVSVADGLRSRFFGLPSSSYHKVKDITADALDRELSQLEKALGETTFVSPSYVVNSTAISSNSYCLEIGEASSFSFIGNDNTTYSEYFNCVFDGFFIPYESGEQYIVMEIANGGVRVFLDDTLILNEWRTHPVSAGTYYTAESEELNLSVGKPYRIRIEAFHKTGDFAMRFLHAMGSDPASEVTPDMTKTIAVIDRVGSKNAPYTPASLDRNKQQNYALYLGGGDIGVTGGMTSSTENKACQLGSSKYIRLPYDSSWDVLSNASINYTGNWTIEMLIKTNSVFANSGVYLSTWVDSGATAKGFEFWSNSTGNGMNLVTSAGYSSVASNTSLSTSNWSHICSTYNSSNKTISYYVNGDLKQSITLSSNVSVPAISNASITFGGKNSYYNEATGAEVAPPTIQNIMFDEFIIYNNALTSDDVKNRYIETQMQELTVYPFLYGGESPVRQIVDEITLADLGRFYIDELNNARYDHYYKLFEPSIDQHANIQASINDDAHILSADYSVQIQANKVVVKISGISSNMVGVQPLWRASDPTTLAAINLESNLTSNALSMYVSTTVDPPFSKAGYVIIDNEIIKYNDKTPNSFLNLERGYFNTTAASHNANTKIREVRQWDLKYDKAPAFQVKSPFITGILFEEPDEIELIRFVPSAYGAELIIAASNNVDKGTFVFAEGTNPLTEKVSFTSIAGIPVVVTEQNSQVKEQVADLDENIRLYGLKEIVIENKFITDFNHGQKIANFIISKMSTPVPILNISTIPTPKIQVGDRIRISSMDAFDIINGDYWVMSKNYTYSSNPSQTMTLRKVV